MKNETAKGGIHSLQIFGRYIYTTPIIDMSGIYYFFSPIFKLYATERTFSTLFFC